jgi:hypothetical protein
MRKLFVFISLIAQLYFCQSIAANYLNTNVTTYLGESGNGTGVKLVLIGMVYEKVTKQPLSAAQVELIDPATNTKQRFVTNQDGRFYFKLVENKSYKLTLLSNDGNVEDQRIISTINKLEPEILHAVLESPRPHSVQLADFSIQKSHNTASAVYDQSSLSFKVQVGAFKVKPGASFMKNLGNRKMITENAGNGNTRYLTGEFDNYKDAQNLEKQLKQLGYSNAFIVAYQKGERLKITAEEAIKQQ